MLTNLSTALENRLIYLSALVHIPARLLEFSLQHPSSLPNTDHASPDFLSSSAQRWITDYALQYHQPFSQLFLPTVKCIPPILQHLHFRRQR